MLPDLYQFEHGVVLDGVPFIGTIHAVICDHMEAVEAAKIHGRYQTYMFTLRFVGPKGKQFLRLWSLNRVDMNKFLLDPAWRKVCLHENCFIHY